MQRRYGCWRVCAGISLGVLSLSTLANQWHAGLVLQSGQSDNGAKVVQQPVAERQDEYRLLVGGDYSNDSAQAAINYVVNERRFSEESQASLTQLEGASRLLLGVPSDSAALLITHSRRSLLQAPGQMVLTDNLDERDILALAPSIHWRFAGVNRLRLGGDYSQVRFDKNPQRNSQRVGGQLQLERQLSQTDQVFLVVQQSDVEFEQAEGADYTYGKLALSYAAQLRRLNYGLQLGYNQRKTNDVSDEHAPFYQLEMGYSLAGQRWQLMASRQITDSSMGDANRGTTEGAINVDGGLNPDASASVQQLDRSFLELRWILSPCELCDFSVYGQRTRDFYLMQGLHALQLSMGAQASYRVSRRQDIALRFERNEQDFDGTGLGADATRHWWQLRYGWQFSRAATIALLAEREKGSRTLNSDYIENYWGLALEYQLH